jgi:hypothetical protein
VEAWEEYSRQPQQEWSPEEHHVFYEFNDAEPDADQEAENEK